MYISSRELYVRYYFLTLTRIKSQGNVLKSIILSKVTKQYLWCARSQQLSKVFTISMSILFELKTLPHLSFGASGSDPPFGKTELPGKFILGNWLAHTRTQVPKQGTVWSTIVQRNHSAAAGVPSIPSTILCPISSRILCQTLEWPSRSLMIIPNCHATPVDQYECSIALATAVILS